jgi:threonine dehydratase
MTDPAPPDVADLRAAADRLRGVAVRTPLLRAPALDATLGATCVVKPEMLQRTGSFKFRGAYNKISRLPNRANVNGVVAFSSGNHAQGVACAAQLLGVPATIVMPSDAPEMKIANTRAYGAEVQLYDRFFEQREAIADRIVAERGATLIRPYDDPDVIAGQGTCGLEIVEQAGALGIALDTVLICCGGGGLAAGCALAVHDAWPGAAIYAVEPAGFDDHARSLTAGTRVRNAATTGSICDSLLAPTPGELTFAVNRGHLAGGLVVRDDEVTAAMAYAYRVLKLVVEPGGAVPLAAALAGRLDLSGRRVGIVMSGGNVDAATFARSIAAA